MLIRIDSEFMVHEVDTLSWYFAVKIAHTADTGTKEININILRISASQGHSYNISKR